MSVSPALPAEPVSPVVPVITAPAPAEIDPRQLLRRDKEIAKALKVFLRENPSQKLTIEGKKYPKREAWQFVAACKGYSAMVTSVEPIISDDGQELGFIATAHTIDAHGRIISGAEGACKYEESEWTGKPSFQLISMAQTRACNKTLCNVLAYIMVMAGLCPTPAEEMGEAPQRHKKELMTQCSRSDCGNIISEKRRQQTRKKYGEALCVTHAREADDKATGMNLVSDPKAVQESIDKMREKKKANGGAQPVVDILDKASFSI